MQVYCNMKYNIIKPWETLDPWQEKVLCAEGNICLRSGRQVGKSTVISIKAGEYAMTHKNKTVMVIASVERSAYLLFEKILSYIFARGKKLIRKGKYRPTKSKINLKNGSKILCLPTGDSGYGIRGHTIDLLIADEAAFIAEDVWTAVTPMLTITRGNIWLLSTPHGREGFYYRCFQDKRYTAFHVSSEDCPRKDVGFLEHEKSWMTTAQYAQEYLGEFSDKLMQFFPDELIKKCQVMKRAGVFHGQDYYMGVDVARMGTDESTFEIVHKRSRENLEQVENITTRKTLTTDTTKMIVNLNRKWDFKKIYIDDGGMGVGVFDQLLEYDETKRKVVAVNNASRSLDSQAVKKKKLLKEDLYNNLLRLMEQGKLRLLDDNDIFMSLKSVQFEYMESGKMRLWGAYTHICEGLIRAAWCAKDKTLNIWVA